jgi:hypothetical protein
VAIATSKERRNHWVCMLNPSDEVFATAKPLLANAYDIAVMRLRPRRRARVPK